MTTALPLPKTIRRSKQLPRQLEYCVNVSHVEGKMLSRPGVESAATATGACRGVFLYADVLYAVYGGTLYKYAANTLISVGPIAGGKPVQIAKGYSYAAICSPGAGNYTLTVDGVLQDVTDPDLPLCDDVERIDGYFIWVPSDGSPVFYSAIGDPSVIDPLDFFDAEVLPDRNTGAINFRNDLFILGAESSERFRNAGPPDAPFVRVSGGMAPVGYLSAKIAGKFNGHDTMFFLGKDRDSGYGFFVLTGGTFQRISSSAIDEILQRDYTVAQLAECVSQRFQWAGHDWYVFTLGNDSFAFVDGVWSYLTSGITVLSPSAWDYKFAALYQGEFYVGKSGSLAKLSAVGTDEGDQVAHGFVTFARSPVEQDFTPAFLGLMVAQGLATGTNSVGLSLSKDAKLWSDFMYRDIGSLGEYEKQLEWRPAGGLGHFDGFMCAQVQTTAPLEFAADGGVIGL